MEDLQLLENLHARDVVSLVAVVMKAKPIATLVVPLEELGRFDQFCNHHRLVRFEDGPSDSYQARMTICQDEKTAELWKELKEIATLFDEVGRNAIVMSRRGICDDLKRTMTRLEGATYSYPECCVELHVEKGPSSRARAYEEFLESKKDRSIPVEFWAVAHAPCSSTCMKTLELGRKYLAAIAEFSENSSYVEDKLLLPRFYQTGGGRFIDLKPLDYNSRKEGLTVSKEQFERDAGQHLPRPVEMMLCEVPRPYVLVEAKEEPPYKTSFPNPDMVGTMWLAYRAGVGAYMVNAKTGKLALYTSSEKWIPKVGEEWRSESNFRIYCSVRSL